ncbi:MAG TPA: S8 family serine peptidase [Pyrinomonadaceae bacterium]|nr:S8 family serine peptidase [Pyrinomonadaceae bacterium]
MKRSLTLFLTFLVAVNPAWAGLSVVKSNGITLTGADGIKYVGINGITLTGADGLFNYSSNGITLTGADGITLTGADGITSTGSNGATYTGPNGITLTGADGITLTGADGITLTGADGITLTGADGQQYTADSILIRRPNGITLTGADGITLTGADGITLTGADGATRVGVNGITLTGADGIALTGADGITLTGADGITLTGADSITGFGTSGVLFDHTNPTGITLTGADGIMLTGADGITLTGADGITLTGADGITLTGADDSAGLQGLDPELAVALNNATDDSNINAVIVYHRQVTDSDIAQLQQLGILGGTRLRVLPVVYVTATKAQLLAVSQLPTVRSLYGNRTLTFDSDPYFDATNVQRVGTDNDLRQDNGGLPVTGRNVTVAVLDTGVNSQHADLSSKVVQNVRLADAQSAPGTFAYPAPAENLANTDLVSGHGTFVGGVIAASGASSSGRFAGVASGARLLGLSAGDLNLMYVLSGFDYLLDKGAQYNVRVVNCSFSANTVFDLNDPVNVATKMLTDSGVNVVFSAGNTGAGNGTMNPYAVAPWVVGVGAVDANGKLANYSSRGNFGDELQHPSLLAPGTNVVSLRSTPTVTGVSGLGGADGQRLSASEMPYYTTATGTSFSAPQVAGAIALMLEANPTLTPAVIKDILSRTATPMPKYFYHEAGAGMLNTYAAVLEAAFPERQMGGFRSTLSRNAIRFVTRTSQTFDQTVFPNLTSSASFTIPQNTVQANVNIYWSLSANDFGLKVYDPSSLLLGESNYLNLPGLTGRREKVVLRNPLSQTLRASIRHSGYVGTSQQVFGAVDVTQVEYPLMLDLAGLSTEQAAQAEKSLLANLMLPEGRKFRPSSVVSRAEFAEAMVRSGFVSQYMTSSAMFTDVHDAYARNVIESVQSAPNGKFIYDASEGGRFYPNNSTTKLAAAIAYVKAAGLESQTTSASLPLTVTDASTIPSQWRGYVAVALQQGFISVDGNAFNPSRGITRIELSKALNTLVTR